MNYTVEQKQRFKDMLNNILETETFPYDKKKISKSLNISENEIDKYLSGEDVPDYATLTRIAGHFGISNSYLLDGVNIEVSKAAYVEFNFNYGLFIKYGDPIKLTTNQGGVFTGRFFGLEEDKEAEKIYICYRFDIDGSRTYKEVVDVMDLSDVETISGE